MRTHAPDKLLFGILIILTTVGFIIFSSASMGLLAREGAQFGAVIVKQFMYGICLGGIALFITSFISYKVWRKYAFYIFFGALILTSLVFIPHFGVTHGGATRWLEFGPVSFQPGELLKLAFVIYLATWLSTIKHEKHVLKFGVIPFIVLTAITGAVFLLQPDTIDFFIMGLAGFIMLFLAGCPWRYIFTIILVGILGGGILIMSRPYVKERIMTFINFEKADIRGAGYQVNQSLIAIGSGGLLGKGFGQSVQKFQYLPEPVGDSIFAVTGEEFGFVGASLLILLFVAFTLRGIRTSIHAPDLFGILLGVGIVVLISAQSLLNIASMLAIFPLTGKPLIFVSQGGTALLTALAEVGILLSISRYGEKK
jgi:cell division protein FtsW